MDLPKPCHIFLNALKPDILILSRTDLWPTLLMTFKNKPKILIASTWSEGSKKTQKLGRIMSQWCLPYLNKVCVVNEDDQRWITEHISNHPEVIITGDPRFDQVRARLNQKRPLPSSLTQWTQSPHHRTFIAGSTWEQDEELLLDALFKLNQSKEPLTQSPFCRIIFVPHENTPTHIQKLKAQLIRLNISFLLWSECENKKLNSNIPFLIFDEKGWLAELYQLADFAFIGGSFKKQVHSVMEALGCGTPVMVGPFYKNNREAIEFSSLTSHNIPFVKVLQSQSAHIAQNIDLYFNLDSTILLELKAKIKDAFEARCGGTKITFMEIQKCL
jgi:3-deoxy-D-manno-octulosonic-acid transferase